INDGVSTQVCLLKSRTAADGRLQFIPMTFLRWRRNGKHPWTLVPRVSAKSDCGSLTVSSVGFRFAVNRNAHRRGHWSDGMGQRSTLKIESNPKRYFPLRTERSR